MSDVTTSNTAPVQPPRVRIIAPLEGRTLADLYPGAVPVPLAIPHPEHIGKLGYIYKVVPGRAPLIVLDDGTGLWGTECWWQYLND